MPARKAAAVKRKAPSSAHSPSTSSKKRSIKGSTNLKSLDGSAASALLQRWAAGVAAQLVSSTQLEQRDSGGGAEIDVEGAGRAAVDALPAGKLRAELRRDEEATSRALRAQVDALRAKQQQEQQQEKKSLKAHQNKTEVLAGPGLEEDGAAAAAAAAAAAGGSGGGVVPCTAWLYRQARATASSGDAKLLKALAVNPRAPLDLLVGAVGAEPGRDSSETLESAVAGMRTLATALAADPGAAVSPSGVAFFADRAAMFASFAATAVANGDATAASAAAAAEACGLMLRILQVAGLAVHNTASAGQADGGGDGGGGEEGGSAGVDPADRLLLPYSPGASSSSPPSDAVVVAAAAPAAAAPVGTLTATKVPPPPAWLSVSRLLAHYAVVSAMCSTRRAREAGATAFIRIARATAMGRVKGGGAESGSDSSSSDDDEDTNDASVGGGGGGGNSSSTLSRHLSALCAASLAGNEPATLEFLRCVGDAVCAAAAPTATATSFGSSDDAVRASLAPTCSRALARLPRPPASPAPTAAQFLKRAYAFRVVGALNRSAAATAAATATPPSSLRLSSKRRAITTIAVAGRATASSSGGGGASAPSWDFVGAGTASPALLEFLGRPEAPAAVGKGPAGAAVEGLCSRRHSPVGVVELLRSSPACAPPALGALLSAMERLDGGGGRGEDGEGGDAVGGKAARAMGGFFLDTGGAGGAGAGAGARTVLARLGSDGGGLADMDEVEVASVVSSVSSGSDDEA